MILDDVHSFGYGRRFDRCTNRDDPKLVFVVDPTPYPSRAARGRHRRSFAFLTWHSPSCIPDGVIRTRWKWRSRTGGSKDVVRCTQIPDLLIALSNHLDTPGTQLRLPPADTTVIPAGLDVPVRLAHSMISLSYVEDVEPVERAPTAPPEFLAAPAAPVEGEGRVKC